MTNQFLFTKKAEKIFFKLPKSVQSRIVIKLKDLKKHEDIFTVLKQLHHLEPASHRLRIGDYRLILECKDQSLHKSLFWILDVGHRRSVYL